MLFLKGGVQPDDDRKMREREMKWERWGGVVALKFEVWPYDVIMVLDESQPLD